ncbi:MAG: transposase family protein [Bdellovibrionaceae bacterium]|nr:transposase family protein [Pseudobdellovibrionaceae bacterium]
MTPEEYVAKIILLPDLKLEKVIKRSTKRFDYHLHKTNPFEVCPKCAAKSYTVHNHRTTCTRHAKYNAKNIHLVIKKRRFWCAPTMSSLVVISLIRKCGDNLLRPIMAKNKF